MSLYGRLAGSGPSGFGYGSTAEEVTQGLSLEGRTLLVTGCNSGIGFETLRVLTLRGGRVVAAARTLEKAEAACSSVGGATLPLACDLSEPESVRGCVRALRQAALSLDAVICNAGIMALPKLERSHGYELQFFTNYVGHFLLVTGLLGSLGERGRVVMLSSSAHRQAPRGGIDFANLDGSRGYRPWRAYGQSKMADLLFAKELARRFQGSGRTANAVHPGVIRTGLQRHLPSPVGMLMGAFGALGMKSVPEGAATQVWAATHPSLAGVSGEYLADCNIKTPRADANDPELARRLWASSEEIARDLGGVGD